VRSGRSRAAKPLSDRFQVAIDDAAMRSGASETDAYLAEWRTSEPADREGEPEEVATVLAAELEGAYPDERLRTLIMNAGREQASSGIR
jgi:Virulence factor